MNPTESRGPLAPKLPPHEPPPELEARVVATLARRGLLAPTRGAGRLGRATRHTLAIAAGIALFVAGAVAQRAWPARQAAAPDTTPRYALLLYGGRTESDAAELARVDEYRQWARGIAARGRYVAGEKLRDDARELTSRGALDLSATDPESLTGFFIVSAATPAEAESIARTCPHLRHGGRVVLRPIEPT